MTEQKSYEGSCHCGAIRFAFTAAIEKVSTCNCSICSRIGYVMISLPEKDVQLLSGADAQTDYVFASKQIHHPFCKTCGIHALGSYPDNEGNKRVLVNLRCVPTLSLKELPSHEFDGKSY